MKQLNLSENQLADLREFYRGKLAQATAAVDEIRGVLRQLEAGVGVTAAPAPATTEETAPVKGRRGPKPGKKVARKGAGRRGRPAKVAVSAEVDAVVADSADAPAEGPKKRGRKPGFKAATASKVAKTGKRRGRKPKNA